MKKTLNVKIEVETDDTSMLNEQIIYREMYVTLSHIADRVRKGSTLDGRRKDVEGVRQQYQYTITEE